MTIEKIKELETKVKELEVELAKSREDSEISRLQKEIEEFKADMERKSLFAETKTTDREVQVAEKKAKDLVLKAKLLGRDLASFKEFKEIAGVIEKAIKPSDIADWMEESFAKEIFELMQLNLKVERLFDEVIVPKGVQKLSFPMKNGFSKAYLIQPATDAIESAFVAGKVTFDPVKIKTLVITADEAENEAVVSSLLQVVKEDIAYSLAQAGENAIVNGDTSGDLNNNPGANDVTMAFNGLRKYGYDSAKIDNGGTAITTDAIISARKALGVLGVNPQELALIVNAEVYNQLLKLPEVLTYDKFGNDLTIKTGTLAKIYGIDIIPTEFIPNTMDSDGKVDGDDNTNLTGAVLVNVKAFRKATRNVVEFEKFRNIQNDTNMYTGRRYLDFQKIVGNPVASAYIVNIDPSK